MIGEGEEPERKYYSRENPIVGAVIVGFFSLLWISGIFSSKFLGIKIYCAVALVAMGITGFRLARSRIEVFERGIRVHNVFSTFELPWQDIARFGVGRWGLLPYVCLIHLGDGGKKPASGIQEKTNFPNGSAEEMAEELNAELARRTQGAAFPTLGAR